MDHTLKERRRDARFRQTAVLAKAKVTMRPGWPLMLVDISASGALVEGARPLRPGSRVHLQIVVGDQRWGIPAHVLRCAVCTVDADDGVTYRGALKFDHRCDLFGEGAAQAARGARSAK